MCIRRFLAFDHQEQDVYLVCLVGEEEAGETADAWMHSMEGMLQDLSSPDDVVQNRVADFDLRYSRTQEEYLADIARCQEFIRKGESYEVCLTMNAHARTDVDPFLFYQALRRQNPAPYSAFLRFGDLQVVCSSPERFLRVRQHGMVESRPIKGTSRRGDNEAEDTALRSALFESAKNRAENLMTWAPFVSRVPWRFPA